MFNDFLEVLKENQFDEIPVDAKHLLSLLIILASQNYLQFNMKL
jgi:hypothetical protein